MAWPASLARYRRLSDYMSGLFRPQAERTDSLVRRVGNVEWFQVPLRSLLAIQTTGS